MNVLERRNTATVEFPNIGLGPLFRLSIEGIDLRDNARDYGITKDAGIVTLSYRPDRRFAVQIGPSVERNYSQIFGNDQKNALKCYCRITRRSRRCFACRKGYPGCWLNASASLGIDVTIRSTRPAAPFYPQASNT
ncbi:MAG: hypothetical protein WDO74_34380 [Pseudomonadota bacterium]